MRTGPESMPVFSAGQLNDNQVAAVIKYVKFVTDPKDPGGAGIGHYGPVPEGLVAIVIGLGGLVLGTLWIGTRFSWSDHPDRPDGAPEVPAGGTPGGKEPNSRVAPGHEGETAWDAQGSVLGRLKHPVSSSGRVTNRGAADGAGDAGDRSDDAPIFTSGVVTTDSSILGR